jgi:putative membrane protein
VLWVKAFHIIFVVSWYAGLLYLPRLFVYHADCTDDAGNARFKVMEKKLLAIMTIGGVGSVVFGLWLIHGYAWQAYAASMWFQAKLALVLVLIGFHFWCARAVGTFRDDRNTRTHRFYRLINEVPALILVAVVILVVVKPS